MDKISTKRYRFVLRIVSANSSRPKVCEFKLGLSFIFNVKVPSRNPPEELYTTDRSEIIRFVIN